MASKRSEKPQRLGKLPPQHKFFLNPHTDARFTRCPKCDRPTKLRKRPLLVLMKPAKALSINKTCRYCPNCDYPRPGSARTETRFLGQKAGYTVRAATKKPGF